MPMRRSTDFPSASLVEEFKRRWRYLDETDRELMWALLELVYVDALIRGLEKKGDRLSRNLAKQLRRLNEQRGI